MHENKQNQNLLPSTLANNGTSDEDDFINTRGSATVGKSKGCVFGTIETVATGSNMKVKMLLGRKKIEKSVSGYTADCMICYV